MNSEDFLKSFKEVTRSTTAERYGHSGDGLEILIVKSELCEAVISTQGAQLLEFIPKGGDNWLWLSPKAKFDTGEAIRGGIPICAPWFNKGEKEGQPKHGFLRNNHWEWVACEENHGALSLSFEFSTEEQYLKWFSTEFTFTLTYHFDNQLNVDINIQNHSFMEMPFELALHTYYSVSNVADIKIKGLENRAYIDTRGGERKMATQEGHLKIVGENDAIYNQISNAIDIEDGSAGYQISAVNLPSVVVWNAGPDLAAKIADIGPGNHVGYVCVENAAIGTDSIQIASKGSYEAHIKIQAL
ncbi:MAG: hypothetical protein MK193_02430 [Lentisphaeria bacterium]|nr:hypothetical protein [Lentisphaeria bacterium]